MGLGESPQHRIERLRRQRTTYPELNIADTRTINEVDRIRRSEGRPPTQLGAATEMAFAKPPIGLKSAPKSPLPDPDRSTSFFRLEEQQRFDEQQQISTRVRNVTGGLEGPQAALPIVGGIASITDRLTGAWIRGALQDRNPIRGAIRGFNEPNVYAQARNLPGINRLPEADFMPNPLSAIGLAEEGDRLGVRDIFAGVADAVFDIGGLAGIAKAPNLGQIWRVGDVDVGDAIRRAEGPLERSVPGAGQIRTATGAVGELPSFRPRLAGASLTPDELSDDATDMIRSRWLDQFQRRASGETAETIRQGRAGQFDAYERALTRGRQQGLSGQALEQYARGAARTPSGHLTFGGGQLDVPDSVVDALTDRVLRDVQSGRISVPDSLTINNGLRQGIFDGARVLQPEEARKIAPYLGIDADTLLRQSRTLAESANPNVAQRLRAVPTRPPGNRRGGAGLPAQRTRIPTVEDAPQLRPRRGLSAAARREQERLGTQLQREAAERIPEPLPTREFPRPTLAASAGNDVPAIKDAPQVRRSTAVARNARARQEQLINAGEAQSEQFYRARAAEIKAYNALDAERITRAQEAVDWNIRAKPRTVSDRVRVINATRVSQSLREIVGMDDQAFIARARELAATGDLQLSEPVLTAVEHWLDITKAQIDALGPEGMSWLSHADSALRGNFTDSYLNTALMKRTHLAQGLRALGMDEKQVRLLSNNLFHRELLRHYGGEIPQHIKDLLRDNNRTAFRWSQSDLRKFVQRSKNTQFGLFDIGVFGVQGLAHWMFAGLQTIGGFVDQIATRMNHPLASFGPAGLERKVLYALEGVDQSVAAAVTDLTDDVGSLLSYVPQLRGVDQRIMRVVERSTDLQFGYVMGNFRNAAFEGQLLINRVLGRDISDPLVRARAATFANHWSSTAQRALKEGRAGAESTFLLSSAMTRAQFGRLGDLVRGVGPKAPLDVRIAAAMTVLSMYAYGQAMSLTLNNWFGDGEYDPNPFNPNGGRITLPNGQVINTRPQSTVFNSTLRTAQSLIQEQRDPEGNAALADITQAWARVALGRGSLPVRAGLALPGYGYEPGYGYRFGDLTRSGQIRSMFPTPPIIEAMLELGPDAIRNDLEAASFVAGTEFIGVGSYPESARSREDRALTEAGYNPDELSSDERITRLGEIGILDDTTEQRRREREELAARGDPTARYLLITDIERDQLAAIAEAAGEDRKRYRDQRSTKKGENRAVRREYAAEVEGKFPDPEIEGDILKGMYFDALDSAYNPATGLTDSDVMNEAIDSLRADLGEERWATLQESLRVIDPRDNPLEQEYQRVVSQIEGSGLWDIPDKAWDTMQSQEAFPSLQNYSSYFEWRDAQEDKTRQQFIAQGMGEGVALDRASDALRTHPVVKAYSDLRNLMETRWVIDNTPSGLADDAVLWEYFRPNEEEEEIIDSYPRP